MIGLIVTLPPVSNFPGGALTYAFHAAAILNSPIYAPGGIAQEFCPSHLKLMGYYTNTEIRHSNLDYSLITTFGKDLEKYLPELPRPIIAVIHDGHTMYEFGGSNWLNKMDGFLVDVDTTKSHILKFVKNASILRIPLPYVCRPFSQFSDSPVFDKKENIIVSLGRIVPDRGHRLVATLSTLGYKVLVVGQEVGHDEYGLYRNKILDAGATIISTPTDDQKFEILSRAKIAMSFPFTQEIDEPIEYNNLESINMGVYPIVANWQKKYFNDANFLFDAVESPAESVMHIEKIFNSKRLYEKYASDNFNTLGFFTNTFKTKFLDFVDSIRNIKKCGNCREYIPINNMYCSFCGKR